MKSNNLLIIISAVSQKFAYICMTTDPNFNTQ